MLCLECHFALGAEFLREQVVQCSAYHSGNQRIIGPILDIAGINVLTVSNDFYAVTQLKQLFQLMRYKDDADAAVTQLATGFHELCNFLLTQRGGRLVHNNHFCINQNRLGDFNHLLYAHAKGSCRLFRINVLSQRRHDFLCLFMHGLVIKQAARPLNPFVDKDIIRDAE